MVAMVTGVCRHYGILISLVFGPCTYTVTVVTRQRIYLRWSSLKSKTCGTCVGEPRRLLRRFGRSWNDWWPGKTKRLVHVRLGEDGISEVVLANTNSGRRKHVARLKVLSVVNFAAKKRRQDVNISEWGNTNKRERICSWPSAFNWDVKNVNNISEWGNNKKRERICSWPSAFDRDVANAVGNCTHKYPWVLVKINIKIYCTWA